ncbi:MerR family transcriptional regulator [Gorillibacterium timonense]|uniref:MerR family transcriptional regulator n=1 Tax=Gorillibacterium timonense TaxID=1689269 RepID=UPI00071C3BC7|nr:MerR family transcriptional regulator [Gorillibacterium timonense]
MAYTIKEAAEQSGLTVHTLRYYEQEGLMPAVARDERGNRMFEAGDMEWLHFICCLRDTGMPVAQVKHFAELAFLGDHTMRERLQILQEHKQLTEKKMEEMDGFLQKITHKTEWYERLVRETEAAAVKKLG